MYIQILTYITHAPVVAVSRRSFVRPTLSPDGTARTECKHILLYTAIVGPSRVFVCGKRAENK